VVAEAAGEAHRVPKSKIPYTLERQDLLAKDGQQDAYLHEKKFIPRKLSFLARERMSSFCSMNIHGN
jgi:hypothetical protein